MIVRLLTARVRDGRSSRLHALFREQLPLLHAFDGLIYTKLARRFIGDTEELILFEEWRDPAALYAWTGTDVAVPHLPPGAAELIEDVTVIHYESLDVIPD